MDARKCKRWPRCSCIVRGYEHPGNEWPNDCGAKPACKSEARDAKEQG
jgi:hypothetical protein